MAGFFFPSTHFCATLYLLLLFGVLFVCIFLADRDYYGSQEDRANQTTPLRLHITVDTSPSGRSAPIHLPRGRAALPRVALHSFIRSREGFSYLQRILQIRHPDQRMADTMLPRPSELPRSYKSSIPTCVSVLAPLCLSRVGGLTSRHGLSTRSISCGRMTVRSSRRFLWPPT